VQAQPRREVLVFRGIGAERLGIEKIAESAFGREQVRTYTIVTHGAAVFPVNQLKLDRLPAAATVAAAAAIFLLDMPAEPDGCLPRPLQQQIVESVGGGARLFVFGGAFGLGKGGYVGAPLAAALPVELRGPWEMKRFTQPELLRDGGGATLEAAGRKACTWWYHDVGLRSGAQVALTAGTKPMFVHEALGQGSVGVVLAAPLGELAAAPETEPFWSSRAWCEWLLAQLTRTGP
jgi:hypothetical protein